MFANDEFEKHFTNNEFEKKMFTTLRKCLRTINFIRKENMFTKNKLENMFADNKKVCEHEINVRNFKKVIKNNKFENMFANHKYCLRIWKKCSRTMNLEKVTLRGPLSDVSRVNGASWPVRRGRTDFGPE
jgi:hypothetical protein